MRIPTSLILTAVASCLFCSAETGAQNLLIPDSTGDRVVIVSANDGSVVNANFIDIGTQAAAAGVTSTPIEAIEVGNEVWVSDQVADRIWRFSRGGGFLGDVGVGDLNNIRGMEVVGDTVYVAQGSASTTLSEGIVRIDAATRTVTDVFLGRDEADVSYWDVKLYNGELLVTNSDTGNDGIERYDLNGNFLGFFAQSDGVASFDFLQQLNTRQTNSNLLGGGFSVPAGVYEFQSDGTALGIVAGLDGGPRGAFELGNGEILWTNGSAIQSDTTTFLSGGSFRFVTLTAIPEPSGCLAVALIGGVIARRRRAR
jgi:hypothetical protein